MTDLTEQWKKGELPYAEYYIKLGGGEYTNDVWDIGGWQSFNKKGDVVIEVLAPVPSYEELQSMNDAVNQAMAANIKLVEQNKQLKEDYKRMKKLLQKMEESDNAREKFQNERIEKLKEALKDCQEKILLMDYDSIKIKILQKIDEVLNA